VEAIGVSRTESLVERADILLWLGESNEAPAHAEVVLVHSKVDVRGGAPEGSLGVSSVTGEGLAALLEVVATRAKALLPSEDAIALNRRQAALVEEAAELLEGLPTDTVLVAETLRLARQAFDRLTGRAGVEDVLDALFSRFCLGK